VPKRWRFKGTFGTTFVTTTDGIVDTQSKAHRFAAEGLALHPDDVNERRLRALSFSHVDRGGCAIIL
jgi:hypothetical protein